MGGGLFHFPSDSQTAVGEPDNTYPSSHVYVATEPYTVAGTSTSPLIGALGGLQITPNKHNYRSPNINVCKYTPSNSQLVLVTNTLDVIGSQESSLGSSTYTCESKQLVMCTSN